MLTLSDVQAARDRIRPWISATPCLLSPTLTEQCGAQVHLKLENHQRTGSFKERGAANRLLLLGPEERARGVVAASAGNHAQGVAVNAMRLNIQATIVMPEFTPLIKLQSTRALGAEVILHGQSLEESLVEARRLEHEKGMVFVHAFDDPAVIAGQGTCGLELLEQVPDLDVLVAAVGGGGWLGGMALAVKELRPSVRVVGVEAAVLSKMQAARAQGRPVLLPAAQTLCDGIAMKRAGDLTLPLFERYVDELVSVDDEEVASAILLLIEREKTVVEGAGAAPLASLIHGKIKGLRPTDRVVCVLSGGNIDVNVLARIIERGLVKAGRRVQLALRVPDRPGMLAAVLACVARLRANVLEVFHQRAFLPGPIGDTGIELTLETRGPAHVEELVAALVAEGYNVRRVS